MNKMNNLIPTGITIKENLDALGISQKEFAKRMGITEKHVIDLIKGRSAITPETAIGLSNVIGSTPKFWMNLDAKYQIEKIAVQESEILKKEKNLLSSFSNAYKHLKEMNLVEDTRKQIEKIYNLRQYFGVANLLQVEAVHDIAFRKSDKNTIDKYALAAWLRYGERKANEQQLSEYDKNKFKQIVTQIRDLNTSKAENYSKSIKDLLNSVGVKIYYTEYFPKTYTNGCVRWINNHPVILISLRHSYEDTFWFTLMHEIGHVLLHGKNNKFIEYLDPEKRENKQLEEEADKFAQDSLIDPKQYEHFVSNGDFSVLTINKFAKSINVLPGIVAGRLAYDEDVTEYEYSYARKYRNQLKIVQH